MLELGPTHAQSETEAQTRWAPALGLSFWSHGTVSESQLWYNQVSSSHGCEESLKMGT